MIRANSAPDTVARSRRSAAAAFTLTALPAGAQVQDLTTSTRNGSAALNASNQLVLTTVYASGPPTSTVPEPGTIGLVAAGQLGLGGAARRRRRGQA